VVTEDLRQVVEELSGQPFDQFFDQWLYHARFPDLKISYHWLPRTKQARVTIQQTQQVNRDVLLFRIPTKLRFVVGGKTVDHPIELHQKQHDFYVPLPAKPQIVRFDPDYSILARITFDKPDDMLLAQLEDRQDVIGRLLAIRALARRKTRASVDALKSVLAEAPFFGVRIAASNALQTIHNDQSYAALLACRRQPDARVRQHVVQDLGKFFREETIQELQQILATEKNPAIAAAAVRALGRFHGQTSRSLIEKNLFADSFRNELTEAAVAAIRMQNDPGYAKILIRVLAHKEDAFAARGLGQTLDALARVSRDQGDKTEVRECIARYIRHRKQAVQIAAIDALGTLKDPAASALLEPLAGDDRDDRIAKAAHRALESIRKETPLVPAEIVQLRKDMAQLKKSNEKLRKDLDELKKRVDAGTLPAGKAEK
jgi:aminopeptidase N